MASEAPINCSLVVESKSSAVVEVCKQILAKLKENNFDEDDIFAVHLTLEEAFLNAVKHGNKMDPTKKVKIDWQFMLLVGILIGAFFASRFDGSFKMEAVPPYWLERFGGGVGIRAVGAFLGGIVAMFGARLAGGCPSGHGLSGLMQLSISGFIAMIGFFAAGVLVARLLYRNTRLPEVDHE